MDSSGYIRSMRLYNYLLLYWWSCFFSLSARILGFIPDFFSKRVLAAIFILIVLYIVASASVIIINADVCTNIGRLMLSGGTLFFTIIFSIICFLMIRTISVGDPSIKKAVSKSFMLRHTRPLTIILLIYIWTSVIDLALQVYLNLSTVNGEDCHDVVANNALVLYSYPIFKQVDELLPILSVLWYFFITTRRDFKKSRYNVLPEFTTSQPMTKSGIDKSFAIGTQPMTGYETSTFSPVTSEVE